MPDSEFLDSNGKPLHGGALASKREAEVHRREAELAEAERHLADRAAAMAAQRGVVRALSRVLMRLCAQQSGLSGPDVLRRLADDPEDALAICESAGLDSRAVRASWHDAAPGRPAQSRSDFWSQFPDHDGDFMAGRRQLPDVAAEYDARQRERQAQRQSSVLWRTRDGTPVTDGGVAVIGASFGPSGAPVQRSVVSESVPPLGEEVLDRELR